MLDKRKSRRLKRRLRVIFGEGDEKKPGYTTNLSPAGFSINSTFVYPAGSRVQGRIWFAEGNEVDFVARVSTWVSMLTRS